MDGRHAAQTQFIVDEFGYRLPLVEIVAGDAVVAGMVV